MTLQFSFRGSYAAALSWRSKIGGFRHRRPRQCAVKLFRGHTTSVRRCPVFGSRGGDAPASPSTDFVGALVLGSWRADAWHRTRRRPLPRARGLRPPRERCCTEVGTPTLGAGVHFNLPTVPRPSTINGLPDRISVKMCGARETEARF